LAATDLGATSQADKLKQQYAIESNKAQSIHAGHAASYVRWGDFDPPNPLQPYADIDQALHLLDNACQCDWATVDVTDPSKRKLVFDRMLALRDRHRATDVIAHYEQLMAHAIELPVYVMSAAADAYLELREPEQALAVLDAILIKEPEHYNSQLDKFYALIELERFEEATQHINQISASQPSYLNRNDNPVVRQNDKKLQADTLAIMGMAYGDNLAGSEQALIAQKNIGPNNLEIKNNLANVWRWRGWVDLAGKTYQENLSIEKYNTQARYGLAHTYLDGRDWVLASNQIEDLNSYITPDDPALKELNTRWALHQKRQFITNFNTGNSSGAAIGTRASFINAWLYSAPFNDNYRVFANADYNHGTFPEGSGAVLAPAVGLEYRSHDWVISSQLGVAAQDGQGATGGVRAVYRADD
jgi:biofilm PGA synthesis protein PgaA